MSTTERRFHETWMGMVQPIEGLVVSVPVLVDADIAARRPPELHERFRAEHVVTRDGGTPELASVRAFVEDALELGADLRDDDPPEDLAVYLPEGSETIRATWALRRPEVVAGACHERYQLLAWELPSSIELDRPDERAGVWAYPPRAKMDRLLRATGVPIGLLTNGRVVRLVYAPPGESTGAITFRVADMAKVDGRPILDALVMLLHARRFEGAGAGRSLPELLAASRRMQAEVSRELEAQVKAALERLLRGFEEAAERDGSPLVAEALADGTLTQGLLTLLLRLVFVLFAEDRELLPMESMLYREGMSVLGLFERLQADAGTYPDAMGQRFGAYGRLVALFRAVFLGVRHDGLVMPPRYGDLFDPHRFPFLEGWGPAGGAPITLAEDRARVRIPSVDDGCVFDVLRHLLYLRRERLSYRALDVEQVGSVYEALLSFEARRLASPAVRLGPYGVWIEVDAILNEEPRTRAKWLKEATDLSVAKCEAIVAAVDDSSKLDKSSYVNNSSKNAGGGALLAFSALAAFVGAGDRAEAGRLVLQPGADRKHTSSHYTPRSLSEPVVEKTLRPLIAAMGEAPTAAQILSLKVCDPAMGSGAFLVAACRFLAGELVAAWAREGSEAEARIVAHGDLVTHARRMVAQTCLYGVDKNPFAVSLGKLSLWLATLAKDEPFTYLDHALRCGDSLVGLTFEQIEKFTWEPVAPAAPKKGQLELDLFRDEIAFALKEALAARRRIEALASERSAAALKEKERALEDATDALARVRLIGDLVVGAFFARDKPKEREAERARREALVRAWLHAGGPVPPELADLAEEARAKLRPFHWAVEFPEVFFAERADPLEPGGASRVAYVDAFVGNPPFQGKNGILASGGPAYIPWLQVLHPGSHGNADLVAHFFRRTNTLLGTHGAVGLIATKTIAQGDTRATALQPLVGAGLVIYDATRIMPWPGEAAVSVSVVHLAKGSVIAHVAERRLDGAVVPFVSSRLRAGAERPDPVVLTDNADKSFQGSIVLGMGFTLTPEERAALVAKDARNAERTFPYLGGEEVNSSPTQTFERYVINFGTMSLEEAERWPDLLSIVREKVKPERDKLADNPDGRTRKANWWRFGRLTPALERAIAPLKRCLVNSQVTKHLVFAFQPTNRVFSHTLYAYPFDDYSRFAVVQSRVHEGWARLLSSSMKGDLRYAPSDCFSTFPFPAFRSLEGPGKGFYEARAEYMRTENVGLTTTYNRLKDPDVADARIEELRALTLAMDRAVLAAYGWSDLEPPPFTTPRTDEEKKAASLFEDTVVDRLFALNAERAAAQGSAVKTSASAAGDPATDTAPKKKRAAKRPAAPARETDTAGTVTGRKQATAKKKAVS
ncbi:MAG: hypothetical protein KIT84_38755 [Labilithrix sp.]|nr:hypothetical protein [Labilithrix sp.]MCW5817002.1 hypothetical protein [Labilithrix sp.]